MARVPILMPLLSASLAATLLGCTAGPDFVAPERPATSAYTSEGDAAMPAGLTIVPGQAASATWWQMFNAPALDRVVNQALAENHSLAAATAALDQARQAVTAESGALYPELDLDASAGRQKYGVALFGPADFRIPPFTYYTAGPSLHYLIDVSGVTKRSIEEQEALAAYQGYQRDATRVTLTGDVVSESIAIAALRSEIDAVQTLLANDAQTLRLAEVGLRAGSLTRPDVLTARARLTDHQALLPPLQQQLSSARHALAILVGKAPGDWTAPDFDLDQFTVPASLPLTVPSELVHVRPDIRAAEAQLHAATAALGVAAANLYPQITLSASITQEALTPWKLFDAASMANSLSAGLSQPLFDGGTLEARERAAQAALRGQHELYQQTVIMAFGEVAEALRALALDSEQWNTRKAALQLAEQSVAYTHQRNRAGDTGILQVLESERNRQQALLDYDAATLRHFQDMAHLFVVLGAGAKTDGAEAKGAEAKLR